MPRPRKYRQIRWRATATYFKPQGIPLRLLEEISLTLEEIEAIRLKDFLGFEQIKAAKEMKTSQSTFQRILTSARKKIAQGIIEGKALKINKTVNK